MKIALIVSKGCPAGDNVKDCLLETLGIDDNDNVNNENNNNDDGNNNKIITINNNNNNNKINNINNKNNNDDNNKTLNNNNKNKIIKILKNNNNKNNNNKGVINRIININDNTKIYLINKLHVYADNLDKDIRADLFIFATTHKSSKGTPSLSVHTSGNWGRAELGGKDKQLCVAPAFFLKESLMMLEKINNTPFEVMQECTHHGPFIQKPSMFIEIGSSEKQWSNKDAGMVNAKVISYLINHADEIKNRKYKSALGIGGLHHTPNFKSIILDTNVAIGHVCPKYNLQNLSQEMLEQAIERTLPRAEFAVIDWKGLGGFKDKVKNLLEKNKLVYKKTKEL